MDVTPVPMTSGSALPLEIPLEEPRLEVALLPTVVGPPVVQAADSIEGLCGAVLAGRRFMTRRAAPTPEQERAWRESAGWRAG